MTDERFLRGRVALVTGSTGEGMGGQIALTLARHGADVALNFGTYRTSRAGADRMQKRVEEFGVRSLAVKADTRDEAQSKALVSRVREELGPIDIAVGNAGGDFLDRPLDRLSLAQWRRVVEPELDGAFLLARLTIPGMRRRGWGRLVYIGWEGAERAYKPPYDYAVGKMARDALAAKLARAEADSGVTVNVVAPGYIPYPSAKTSADMARHGPAWTTRKRATTQDVADAVLWLCRDEARFVTGSSIRIHGPA